LKHLSTLGKESKEIRRVVVSEKLEESMGEYESKRKADGRE
jgi:hypothetical protein